MEKLDFLKSAIKLYTRGDWLRMIHNNKHMGVVFGGLIGLIGSFFL